MYSTSLCSYGRFSCRQLIVWFWRMLSSSFLCTGFTATLLFLSCISDSSHMPASLIFFFSFYICDLKNSYADHRVTSPVFTGPNHPYIHPPSVDLCNSCSIWCVRVSDISAVIFTSLSSSHSKAWSESPTLYAWQPLDIPHTHGWSCLFCWLTGCVCVYVCVCWLCDCVIVVLNEASWVSHPICHLCRRCYKGPWEMQSWRLSPPPYVSRGSSQSTCHC